VGRGGKGAGNKDKMEASKVVPASYKDWVDPWVVWKGPW